MYLCQSENKHTLHCEGNKRGACLGRILFLDAPDLESVSVAKETSLSKSSAEKELERYLLSLEKVRREREELYMSLKNECDAAWIFLMHTALLGGSLFGETATRYISEGKSAAEAVFGVMEHFSDSLTAGKENLRALTIDVADLCASLLYRLSAFYSPASLADDEGRIILSAAPHPSFIAKNKRKISAMVASPAILRSSSLELLSALSIPTLLCEDELDFASDGEYAIADSDRGILHVSPDLSTLEDFSELEEKTRQREKRLSDLSERETKGADGKRISLFAEIEKAYEIEPSLASRCDGIGILSCEELYLERLCMPDEDALFERYRRAAELMPTRPVIIRALRSSCEVRINSMISERGGEVYVFQSTALKTQLRAAMRASVFGNVCFLISPHGSHSSVSRCERLAEEAAQELSDEGREFSTVQIGLEIDTPAEALTCKSSVCDADFAVVNVERLSPLLDGEHAVDGEYESTIKKEALGILLSEVAKIKKETRKKFLISLGKKADRQLLKKSLALGFDSFCVAASAIPETKLTISEL